MQQSKGFQEIGAALGRWNQSESKEQPVLIRSFPVAVSSSLVPVDANADIVVPSVDMRSFLLTSNLPVKIRLEHVCQMFCHNNAQLMDDCQKGDIINLSTCGVVPMGADWTYYALTRDSKRITTAQQVVKAHGTVEMVILAMWQ
jgi:hypothetical protein